LTSVAALEVKDQEILAISGKKIFPKHGATFVVVLLSVITANIKHKQLIATFLKSTGPLRYVDKI
jgi:hypothetical protein